jgi:hypothetical protein
MFVQDLSARLPGLDDLSVPLIFLNRITLQSGIIDTQVHDLRKDIPVLNSLCYIRSGLSPYNHIGWIKRAHVNAIIATVQAMLQKSNLTSIDKLLILY